MSKDIIPPLYNSISLTCTVYVRAFLKNKSCSNLVLLWTFAARQLLIICRTAFQYTCAKFLLLMKKTETNPTCKVLVVSGILAFATATFLKNLRSPSYHTFLYDSGTILCFRGKWICPGVIQSGFSESFLIFGEYKLSKESHWSLWWVNAVSFWLFLGLSSKCRVMTGGGQVGMSPRALCWGGVNWLFGCSYHTSLTGVTTVSNGWPLLERELGFLLPPARRRWKRAGSETENSPQSQHSTAEEWG